MRCNLDSTYFSNEWKKIIVKGGANSSPLPCQDSAANNHHKFPVCCVVCVIYSFVPSLSCGVSSETVMVFSTTGSTVIVVVQLRKLILVA